MNKIIPFNKDIKFNENIGEIISIALDDNLSFKDSYTITGELAVKGSHKNYDIIEDFSYELPTQIAVDSKYDTKDAKISVDDFYYEIINEDTLRVKIDLILDDLYYKETKTEPLSRDILIDEELENNQEAIQKIDDKKEEMKEEKENNIQDLFKETNEEKDYSIYRVYLVTSDDTLDKILAKYKVTSEELANYNDLTNLKPGMKLIIPSTDE